MKVVFLCREGLVARYLAHELAAAGRLDALVVEDGGEARRRKLARELERTPWWRTPLLALDLLALAIYGRLWTRALARRLASHPAARGYPRGVPLERVEDANDAEAVAVLGGFEPDVMLVLGTSILRAPVLAIPKVAALNVHGGIVPAYRNVHSEVWAVLAGDTVNVGTSILHLDEGVDSGAIALDARVEGARGFFDLRWKNVQLSARLALEALELLEEGRLPNRPQMGDAGFHRTPGALSLARLALRRVR